MDKRIIDLLIFGKQVYYQTAGKVNIAYKNVLKLWYDYRTQGIDNSQNAELPLFDKLIEYEEHTNIEDIIIKREGRTVEYVFPSFCL